MLEITSQFHSVTRFNTFSPLFEIERCESFGMDSFDLFSFFIKEFVDFNAEDHTSPKMNLANMGHMVSIITKACRFTDMLLRQIIFGNGEMGEEKENREWIFFIVTVHQSYVHIHVIKFIYFPLLRLSLNADLVSSWNLLFYCLRAVVRGVMILD